MIRSAHSNDSPALAEIYNHYILNTHATFETTPIEAKDMAARIRLVQEKQQLPWYVLEPDNTIVGYAYATQWKPRRAYARTVETSVYLNHDEFGKGYGKQLYKALIEKLESDGYHALLGGIALPNETSIKLHEQLGFKKVAHFKQTGYKFDRWIDVGYWQLLL